MNIYQNIFLSPTKVLENEMPPLEAQHVVRLERPTPSDEIDHVFERVSRQGIPHQRHHALHATHHFGQIFGQLVESLLRVFFGLHLLHASQQLDEHVRVTALQIQELKHVHTYHHT